MSKYSITVIDTSLYTVTCPNGLPVFSKSSATKQEHDAAFADARKYYSDACFVIEAKVAA